MGLTLYVTISHDILPEQSISISTFNYTYLISILTKIRKNITARLTNVAMTTGVSKYTILNIEACISFPNIMFLISYAQALGANIELELIE